MGERTGTAGYLQIGEVAKLAGLTPKTVRYYEEVGLVPPARRRFADHMAGYRLFLPGDVHRLTFIRRARELSLSLKEIKELLRPSDGTNNSVNRDRIRQVIDRKLAALEERMSELQKLREDFKRMKRALAVQVVQEAGPCCDPLCGPTTCRG